MDDYSMSYMDDRDTGGYSYVKVVGWLLLMTVGFGVAGLSAISALTYLFVLILGYYYLKTTKEWVIGHKWYVIYIICIGVSCIYSYMFNQQNPISVFARSYSVIGFFSIFIFVHYGVYLRQAEKAIVVISVLWCCCYLLQWMLYPNLIIWTGALDDVNINDGMFRMRLPGSVCGYCLFLYGINKWMTTHRTFYISYSLLGMLPIFIQGFRSLTAAIIICAFVMIGVISKKVWKTLLWFVVFCVLGLTATQVPIIGEKIEEMVERNDDDQTFENEDYIRYFEYDYYANEFFVKPGEKFFGAGMPLLGKSDYGRKIMLAQERFGYYWVDLGLVGLSWIIGIPAVICLMIILYKNVRECRNDNIQYIRFTLIAITLGSVVTSMELFREGNMVIIGLMLYIVSVYRKEEQEKLDSGNMQELDLKSV